MANLKWLHDAPGVRRLHVDDVRHAGPRSHSPRATEDSPVIIEDSRGNSWTMAAASGNSGGLVGTINSAIANLSLSTTDRKLRGGTLWFHSSLTVDGSILLRNDVHLDFQGRTITAGSLVPVIVADGCQRAGVHDLIVIPSTNAAAGAVISLVSSSPRDATRHNTFESVCILNPWDGDVVTQTTVHYPAPVVQFDARRGGRIENNTFRNLDVYGAKLAISMTTSRSVVADLVIANSETDSGSGVPKSIIEKYVASIRRNLFSNVNIDGARQVIKMGQREAQDRLGLASGIDYNVFKHFHVVVRASDPGDVMGPISGRANHFDHIAITDSSLREAPSFVNEWEIDDGARDTYICTPRIVSVDDDGTATSIMSPTTPISQRQPRGGDVVTAGDKVDSTHQAVQTQTSKGTISQSNSAAVLFTWKHVANGLE